MFFYSFNKNIAMQTNEKYYIVIVCVLSNITLWFYEESKSIYYNYVII